MEKKKVPKTPDRPLSPDVPQPANRDDLGPDETKDVDVPWPEEGGDKPRDTPEHTDVKRDAGTVEPPD